jgi:predicted ATPase
MLTDLRIENFRVFNEEVHLRLRPITVLIGRNSAGKSSIMKFLLMLQQSLSMNEVGFLAPEGDRVHLGAFGDLRNSVGRRPKLKFRLDFTTRDVPSRRDRKMLEAMQNREFKTDPVSKRSEMRIVIEEQEDQITVKEELAKYVIETSVAYSVKTGQTGYHRVTGKIGDELIINAGTKNLRTSQFLRFREQSSDPKKALQSFWTDRFLFPLREEMRLWRHLSPVREESQRAIVTASPPPNSVGQMGEYALPHLKQIFTERKEDAEFILKHMNEVAGVDTIQFESSMKGYLAHARATNKLTTGESYLSDFGFGVSQCLPIFVQGALMRESELLMVEQPEAQLHPSAQLELGTFFAELLNERKVMSLIETHSSQLILRLRRLVANGTLKAEDVSLAYVFVKDGMPWIENLDILPNGNLQAGLPMEFFGADLKEAMDLRAKK